MAQTGFTPLSLYYSATTTNVPLAANLVAGELALNTADGKLFYKDSSGVVQVIGTKGGVGSSSTTQVLYNSSGLVVGSANMTFNGTVLTSSFAGPVAATTLSASSTVSGTGFSTYLASPPAIGGTAAAAGSFTTLTTSSTVTLSGGTANGVTYLNGSKVLTSGTALTFDGSLLKLGSGVALSVQGVAFPASGSGAEIFWDGSESIVQSYNRTSSAYVPLWLESSYTRFGINGAEAMRLTSTGLGIGTSSPQAKLQVLDLLKISNAAQSQGALALGDGSTTVFGVGLARWNGSTNAAGAGGMGYFAQGPSNGGGHYFYTGDAVAGSTTLRATIDTAGNLGLGGTPVTWTNGKAIEIYGVNYALLALRASNAGAAWRDWALASNYNNAGELNFIVGASQGATPSSVAMTLNSSGNLGLGVTPQARLNVQYADSAPTSSGTMSSGVVLQYATGGIALNMGTSSGGYSYFNSAYANNAGVAAAYRFYQGATQAMTLDASGNLGIGTSSPAGKLDVNGTVRLGSLDINLTTANSAVWISGSDFGIGTFYSNSLKFLTSNTERMRLDTSGNLLVGTTSSTLGSSGSIFGGSAGSYESSISVATSGNVPLRLYNQGTSGTQYFMEFRTASAAVGSITYNQTVTLFNTTSDYRLKTVTGALTGHGERIDALQPVEYTWNADGSRTRGFLAHQFQEVYAGSVSGTKDAVDAEGKPVYQAMQASSSEVIADLIAEIQSLRKRLAVAGI